MIYPYTTGEISLDHKSSNPETVVETKQANSSENAESHTIGLDTRETLTLPNAKEEVILEAVEKNPYDVSYTCLLVPKSSSDYLLDDVIVHLQAWMKQICTSFGWRLEFLSVMPDYLHWTIRVPPATSTSYFIRIVREQTSVHMFADIPRFKREKSSGDFWAPGYLIIWGAQPHPIEIIQRFIRQTRQQQGIRTDE